MSQHEDEYTAEDGAIGTTTVLAVRPVALVAKEELTVDDVVGQMQLLEQAMERVMRRDVHYGVIPGTQKPTLLKPGAQKLLVLFRLAPSFETTQTWHESGHLTVVSVCTLTHIPTGLTVATGEGLCSTLESRYRWRTAKLVCPLCAEPQIRRSKNRPKQGDYEGASPSDEPGWYCWRKENGCGANFAADDSRITSQERGKVENPDIADAYNTVLKIANKRSMVDATINGTAASDLFTQDLEDMPRDAPDRSSGSETSGPAGTESARGAAAEPERAAPAPTWAPARSWAELVQRLGVKLGELESQEWLSQAKAAFTETPDGRTLFQRCNDVLIDLCELEVDLQFTPDAREIVARAFSARFDGIALVGPPWALGPDESSLPQRDEYLSQVAAAVESGVDGLSGTDGGTDDIPF